MSRFRILAVFATMAVLAAVLTACGGGGSSSEDPQKIVEEATLKGIESGELDLSLDVKTEGKESGEVEVEASGPFEQGAEGQLPQFSIEASAKGEAAGKPVDFEGALTLLSDRAYVGYEGTEYEVDPTTFGFVRSTLEQSESQQSGAGGSAGATACQKAAEGIEISKFVDNLTNQGSADVDGTSTTEVSGDLNSEGAAEAVIKLTEDPACAGQLQAAGPLPLGELEKAKNEVAESIKKAHIHLYVGDDHIIRKIDADLLIEPEGKGETVEAELELSLGKVNEDVTIPTPSGAKPLELLFEKLGVNPLELLQGASSGNIGELFETLEESVGSPSSGGGSSAGGGSSSGASKQLKYAECLRSAGSASDIQNCASILK